MLCGCWKQGGLANARPDQIAATIEQVAVAIADQWQAQQAVPPLVVWRRTVEETRQTAGNALQHPSPALNGQKCYTEVPFGGQHPKSGCTLPWDATVPVEIADTGFRISGYIDRLDLSGDGKQARGSTTRAADCPQNP